MARRKGSGCTTPEKVDAVPKKHWPRYAKRTGCKAVLPAPGMTDAYLLVERLVGPGGSE